MKKQEIKQINNALLMKLCREIGNIEEKSEYKAKQCTLIINEALVKINEI